MINKKYDTGRNKLNEEILNVSEKNTNKNWKMVKRQLILFTMLIVSIMGDIFDAAILTPSS